MRNFAPFIKCSTFESTPVTRLSKARTSHPSASSLSQRCDPRNPAPPVTTARMPPPPKKSTAQCNVSFREHPIAGMFPAIGCSRKLTLHCAVDFFGGGCMRAVVTGGAGFLGSHLCERLLAEGWDVLAFDNLVTGVDSNVEHLMKEPEFRIAPPDRSNYIHLAGPAEYVIYFASPARPRRFLKLAHPTRTY